LEANLIVSSATHKLAGNSDVVGTRLGWREKGSRLSNCAAKVEPCEVASNRNGVPQREVSDNILCDIDKELIWFGVVRVIEPLVRSGKWAPNATAPVKELVGGCLHH
jgi:hypothetical protein